jgi:hypothetical protein
VLAAVSVSRAIREHIKAFSIEPSVITTGVLAAVLDTHIVGTGLAKKLNNSAKVRTHI